jgi:hypothetical protein
MWEESWIILVEVEYLYLGFTYSTVSLSMVSWILAASIIISLMGVLDAVVAGSELSFRGLRSWGYSVLVHKLHVFGRTQHRFILIQIVPGHVCYMFPPVHRAL